MNAENRISESHDTLFELQEVTQVFPDGAGAIEVLKGINLDIAAGRMIAIMGPSGSGKSTLLKIIGGMLRPTGGRVLFEGRDLSVLSETELAQHRRRHVGYVFQDYNLVENLTAEENVALPLELDGVPTAQARSAAIASLEEMGIKDLAGRWAGDLSGGQAQRVAVARALVQPGRLLLADEPTGALDSVASDEIMVLLRARVDAGATCLMVTHEARLAAWADQILYLRDGEFVTEAETAEGVKDSANSAAEVQQKTPSSGVAVNDNTDSEPEQTPEQSKDLTSEESNDAESGEDTAKDVAPRSQGRVKIAGGKSKSKQSQKTKSRGRSSSWSKSKNSAKSGKSAQKARSEARSQKTSKPGAKPGKTASKDQVEAGSQKGSGHGGKSGKTAQKARTKARSQKTSRRGTKQRGKPASNRQVGDGK